MHVRRHRRTLLVGAAVAAILAGGTGAAVAESTPSPASKVTPTGDGAKALCKRVPKIDHRIDRALNRLNAGADKRGSIARLQQRVDKAEAAGHSEIATYLQDRLTFRKSLVTTLQQRQKDLAAVQTWCKDNNGGVN
ncbi:hypothetical protein AB0N07_27795 [Streptomyces sp. NPDC051172]|uniref:hypothetical protein n=1 Tax=Streptomyces sp. NPDC051172 TaxID=3155796 RepID=UPI003417BF61